MSAHLVLVHSQEDVPYLEAAARNLKALGASRVLVLISPAIVINQEEASSTLDAEIAEIQKAEKAAADRGDYEAAAGYKKAKDEKSLDRATTIANAWKTLPAEQQAAAVRRIFTPFANILNPDGKSGAAIRFTKHQDHYDVQNWLTLLQSMGAAWPKELVPGEFSMAWPKQLASLNLSVEMPRQAAPQNTPAEPAKPKTREEELRSLKFMALKSAATKAGVAVEDKKTSQIIAEILEAEKAQPAVV